MEQKKIIIDEFLHKASKLLSSSKTMKDIFEFTINENSKNNAFIFYNEKGKLDSYKYLKVKENVYKYAASLYSLTSNIDKGTSIILKLRNSPEWVEVFYAVLMSGFKPLLIDYKTSKENTINLAKKSNTTILISDDNYRYEGIKKIVIDDLKTNCSTRIDFQPSWENEIIFCSSGTTGDVKLMIFNGENMVHQICCSFNMAKQSEDIMYPKKFGDIRILAMIPFHHIFGFVAVFLWYSIYGKTIVFPASNSPSDIQMICQKTKISHIFSVPLFWDSLALTIQRKMALKNESFVNLLNETISYNNDIKQTAGKQKKYEFLTKKIQKPLLGKHVRFCISGGGYLQEETAKVINGIGYNLYNGFGMTEIGVTSVELSSSSKERLKTYVGQPFYGVEYKIDNPNKNKEGELLVKSKTTHIKELVNGVINTTTLDKEGFFKTGDIGAIDEKGNLTLKGRIKDVIINSNGENIYPDEIELFFKDLPHVTHTCILGIKGKKYHEEDIALVLETDNSITEEEIKNIEKEVKVIETKLPHHTKVSSIYLAKHKLPLANNMKIKRFQVKKSIEEGDQSFVPINKQKVVKRFDGFDEKTILNIVKPLRQIFSKVLILPDFKIDDEAHWINDLGGDSMNYAELINEIQNHFHITFNEEELMKGHVATINDFVVEILNKQKEK